MNKRYEEPEMLIRNYALLQPNSVMTVSEDPDLNDGDDYTYGTNSIDVEDGYFE